MQLSADQKLQLIDELWVSLRDELGSAAVTEDEQQMLDARWAGYLSNPSSALSLETLKAKLLSARK